MNEPSEDLLSQLEASERAAPGPDDDALARVWGEVERQLDDGAPPPDRDPGFDRGPLLIEPAGSPAVLKVVLGLGAAGLIAGALALALREPPRSAHDAPRTSAATSIADVSTPPIPNGAPTSEVGRPLGDGAPTDDLPSTTETGDSGAPKIGPKIRPKTPPKAPKRTSPTTAPQTLADELALVRRISSALKTGDPSTALALVAEHEREFPAGQFIEERRAAKVRGLCADGRRAAGARELARFESRWPQSIHLSSMREACAT